MNNFLQRIVFGTLYAGLWLGSIWIGSTMYLIFLLASLGLVCHEFLKLHNNTGIWKVVLVCGLAYGLFYTSIPYVAWAYSACFAQIWIAYQMLFQKKTASNNLKSIIVACFHIGIPLLLLYHFGSRGGVVHKELLTGILLLVWTADSFAFVFGSWLGKRPLYTKVSPNKSLEGAVAALFFTPIVSYGIAQFSSALPTHIWVFIGFITASLSVFGDLAQSYIKRVANIKDSGKLMPGHGGLYDRMDSLIFAFPFIYIVFYYLT
jgi:phosphatidate cytidylyltransferase